jgi:hypothetical protein
MDKTEQIFKRYERRAIGRNLTFRITLQEFERLISDRCHYCGEYGDSEHDGFVTLDRVDNRIGYLISNVVPACVECNFAKRVMLAHKFIAMAERITKYQQEKREKAKLEPVAA